jgi:hypothetical protein
MQKKRTIRTAKHGSLCMYQYHQCRCPLCVKGYRAYMANYQHQRFLRARNQKLFDAIAEPEQRRDILFFLNEQALTGGT